MTECSIELGGYFCHIIIFLIILFLIDLLIDRGLFLHFSLFKNKTVQPIWNFTWRQTLPFSKCLCYRLQQKQHSFWALLQKKLLNQSCSNFYASWFILLKYLKFQIAFFNGFFVVVIVWFCYGVIFAPK